LKNFRSLKKATYKQFPDLVLGMGTITDIKTAEKAIQNGADFLVSPGYSKEMSKFTNDENMLWIPGCFTPSELMQSAQSGIEMMKIFPASVAGPEFIRSVKEVFPDLLFLPTGGINTQNMQEWFHAGASAVGMGSGLISNSIMEEKNFDLLKTNTVEAIRQVSMRRQV
jgi:2-dehydro-3-deoxyphosphogluconate aldolase / (4S)-4-hydroxy-2-oxoglutarate aldolase